MWAVAVLGSEMLVNTVAMLEAIETVALVGGDEFIEGEELTNLVGGQDDVGVTQCQLGVLGDLCGVGKSWS